MSGRNPIDWSALIERNLTLRASGERRSTADPVPTTFVCWGQKRLALDDGHLDGRLGLLVPHGWRHCKPGDWEPFVRRAMAMGLL